MAKERYTETIYGKSVEMSDKTGKAWKIMNSWIRAKNEIAREKFDLSVLPAEVLPQWIEKAQGKEYWEILWEIRESDVGCYLLPLFRRIPKQ